MTGKRKNTGDHKDTKTKVRRPMSMERKVEIIKRLDAGSAASPVSPAAWPIIHASYTHIVFIIIS